MNPALRVFSVGHSNHSAQALIDLLKKHDIQVVADVRSHPQSRYAPHFDTSPLKANLQAAGINYISLSRELGGRPDGAEFYDAEGHVLYSKLATSPVFLEGIERVEKGARTYRIALLCSEENPVNCHRRLLVGRVLRQRGISLDHIRGDGRLQTEEDLLNEEARYQPQVAQIELFHPPLEPTWRSTQSVSRKSQPPSSSER